MEEFMEKKSQIVMSYALRQAQGDKLVFYKDIKVLEKSRSAIKSL